MTAHVIDFLFAYTSRNDSEPMLCLFSARGVSFWSIRRRFEGNTS